MTRLARRLAPAILVASAVALWLWAGAVEGWRRIDAADAETGDYGSRVTWSR